MGKGIIDSCGSYSIRYNLPYWFVKFSSERRFSMGDISAKAKLRLACLEFYNKFKDVSLTCKTFNISRPTFYKWKNRYSPDDLTSLEDKSKAPHRRRKSQLSWEQERKVIKLRKKYLAWGKKKLQIVYQKEYEEYISQNHIQQVINKYNLYPVERKKKRIRTKRKRRKKIRINNVNPKDFLTDDKAFFICADTIVLYLPYGKRYILTAIDKYKKLTYARVYKTASSLSAFDFLLRLMFLTKGRIAAILSDNGSEFEKYFEQACKKLGIKHIYTRPRTPQDNPEDERFNGILKQEFMDLDEEFDGYLAYDDLTKANEKLTSWLVTYNYIRPHQSLEYQTPIEYTCGRVLTMCPPRTFA